MWSKEEVGVVGDFGETKEAAVWGVKNCKFPVAAACNGLMVVACCIAIGCCTNWGMNKVCAAGLN